MRKRLPLVIQHSIKLVSHSGTRYLWVDCLCIVQNDKRTGDQLVFLPEIYSRALFTIIAAAETNGLLGSMADVKSPVQTLSVGSLHEQLLVSRWASRGWTFQEHMISKRSIVFLERTIFWDCQDSVWWPGRQVTDDPTAECEVQVTAANLSQGVHGTDRILPQRLMPFSGPILALYRELVCRYNHRDLTNPQDALAAFSGVLDAFIPFSHYGFISGLPTSVLGSVLLWQPRSKAKRRVAASSDPNLTPPSPLPSWSWIGWQCLVDPNSLRSGLNPQVDGSSSWYPSPLNDNLSVDPGSRSTQFLSITTTSAKLRIRRTLVPSSRIKPRVEYQSALSASIFNTSLYKDDPEVDTLCPVITLEDYEGRWAGVMRVMDDVPTVGPAQTIEVVAISRGSCSYWEAASTYEATVDRLGCYKFDPCNGDHYHFECRDSGPLDAAECKKILAGSNFDNRLPLPVPPSPVFFENRLFGRDQGPLFPLKDYDTHSGSEEKLPETWRDKTYEFYNVLWVETRGNIRYRKAAGRISKDIWENSCGAPQKIVLG